MQISIQNQTGLDAILSVKISPEDYAEVVKKAVTKYQKQMNLPGFRKGQIPFGVANKMVGKDVKREEIDKLLQKGIEDYLKENNVKLVLSPLSIYTAEDINWGDDAFEFLYDIGLKPDIKPDFAVLDSLSKYHVTATDKDIDLEVEDIRKRSGKMDRLDVVSDDPDSSVMIQFYELNEDGSRLEDGQKKMKVWMQSEMPESIKNLVLGKAKEEKITVDIFSIFSEKEIGDLFEIDNNTVKDLNKNFELDITAIYKISPADLDQALFDRYFTPGTITNVDEFKAEWVKVYEKHFDGIADELFFTDARKLLIENNKVEMPEAYIKKYILASHGKKDASEIKDFETEFVNFEEELNWVLLSDTIAESQQIEVSENDVINYTISLVLDEHHRNNIPLPDDKQIQEYAINYLQKEGNYSRTVATLRDSAVFKHIRSIAKPSIKEVTAVELTNIRNEYSKKHEHTHEHEQHNH